jgi:cyclopropane-fatty-acyl-phospholipid synthase
VETTSEEMTKGRGQVSQPTPTSASRLGVFLNRLISRGRLTIIEPDGHRTVCGPADGEPRVTVYVHHEGLFHRLMAGGSLAFGESYADGWWSVADDRLCDFFALLFANNVDRFFMQGPMQTIMGRVRSWRPLRSWREKSRDDIRVHYDLSNDFFALMLDPTMSYSCGYAYQQSDTLHTMQEQKLRRISQKLGLEKGGELLDIGCGWGGLLLYAAKHYPNVRGVGVTLSEEQYLHAHRAIREQGVSDRFRVQLLDYRDVSGRFDFVVSVGMFEHVGYASYATFFDKLAGVLKPTGVALLHTIGIEEEPSRAQDPWMDRYIFPGSRLPRLEELVHRARRSQLAVGHVENWRPHYALTLRHWRDNFVKNWGLIQRLGTRFDTTFYRRWDFYLQLCEACFIDSTVELYQLLLTPRPAWNLPLNLEFGRQ